MTRTHPDQLRLGLDITDATVGGQPVDATIRTHSATLWFAGDRVVKRKRPVALGFLDFGTLEAHVAACRREAALNWRLGGDVHLGLADVAAETHADLGALTCTLPAPSSTNRRPGTRHRGTRVAAIPID